MGSYQCCGARAMFRDYFPNFCCGKRLISGKVSVWHSGSGPVVVERLLLLPLTLLAQKRHSLYLSFQPHHGKDPVGASRVGRDVQRAVTIQSRQIHRVSHCDEAACAAKASLPRSCRHSYAGEGMVLPPTNQFVIIVPFQVLLPTSRTF